VTNGKDDQAELERKNQTLMKNLASLGLRFEASVRLLSAISSLTAVPVRASDVREAAAMILTTLVQELTDIEACSILLYDVGRGRLRLLAARGQADFLGISNGPYNQDLEFGPGEGIAGRVFAENAPYFWDQSSSPADLLSRDDAKTVPLALASLPLSSQNRPVGVLNVSFSTSRPFDHPRRRDLTILCEVVANIIHTFLLQAELKVLRGFLPICSVCKKIRDDAGYWQRIEEYIQDHSEAQFSHGICPDCKVKLYPELFRKE
jgi:transcriptional regulator with GAF, ATPase, and Fis domain